MLVLGCLALGALCLLALGCAAVARSRRRPDLSPSGSGRVRICCPGGGVFFWWQLGAIRELLSLFDLPDHVSLSGYSAGALAIVMGQCGVDPAVAYASAFKLADDAGCFRSPLGLFGTWGRLVAAWLDALLPADAAARCTGRCRVVVTQCWPLPRARGITTFQCRQDVVSSLMASTHIPFFMDGRPTSRHVRGAADGGLLTFLGLASALSVFFDDAELPAADGGGSPGLPAAIVLSAEHDAEFGAACRANGWRRLSMRGSERFSDFGASWVRREADLGAGGSLAVLAPFRRADPCGRAAASGACAGGGEPASEPAAGARRRQRIEADG